MTTDGDSLIDSRNTSRVFAFIRLPPRVERGRPTRNTRTTQTFLGDETIASPTDDCCIAIIKS